MMIAASGPRGSSTAQSSQGVAVAVETGGEDCGNGGRGHHRAGGAEPEAAETPRGVAPDEVVRRSAQKIGARAEREQALVVACGQRAKDQDRKVGQHRRPTVPDRAGGIARGARGPVPGRPARPCRPTPPGTAARRRGSTRIAAALRARGSCRGTTSRSCSAGTRARPARTRRRRRGARSGGRPSPRSPPRRPADTPGSRTRSPSRARWTRRRCARRCATPSPWGRS